MTVISCMMRRAARFSHIASVVCLFVVLLLTVLIALLNKGLMRGFFNIANYVPIPSDAMVTPVTFRVRRRRLRGFLEECSAAEDGTRSLSGEWVVGKQLWKRLQTEWKKSHNKEGGTPTGREKPSKDRVVFFIHGGTFYFVGS